MFNPDLSKISNAYYNKGLKRAQLNDLTGAAGYLKNALHYDKFNTDARNLLGLIFYQMGETADALSEWVISLNFDKGEGNPADRYLAELQRDELNLSKASAVIKRFNEALSNAKGDGADFAIIELQDITAKQPNYVRAELLLALLYMEKGEYVKAGGALLKVLDIDRNNPDALILMDEVKKATGKADIEEAKLKNAFSHRSLAEDDVIIPKNAGRISLDKVVLLIAAGIVIGLISFYILILPTVKKKMSATLNDNIIANSRELSDVNADYAALKQDYDKLEATYNDVNAKFEAYEKENAEFTSIYEMLNRIENDYNEGKYESAAKAYNEIDRDAITKEPLVSLLASVDRLMLNTGFDNIVKMGTNNWNSGDKEKSEYYYRLALSIKPGEPEASFLLARLIQSEDRITEANEIFDDIISNHPDSPYAQRSTEARGY